VRVVFRGGKSQPTCTNDDSTSLGADDVKHVPAVDGEGARDTSMDKTVNFTLAR